jgi:hypothetical protein
MKQSQIPPTELKVLTLGGNRVEVVVRMVKAGPISHDAYLEAIMTPANEGSKNAKSNRIASRSNPKVV